MSEPMKKHHIEVKMKFLELKINNKTKKYSVPESKAKALLEIIDDYEVVDGEKVVSKYYEKTSKNGTLLRAARKKEGLTQKELSKKLWGREDRQGDIAKMEKGERVISEGLAMQLSKILKLNSKIFK